MLGEQVAAAVDLIVHQTRFKDGSRHITHITEVERMEGDVITLQDIFLYDHSAGFDAEGRARGALKATGSTDPDVLLAAKEEFATAYRPLRWFGIWALVCGALCTALVLLAFASVCLPAAVWLGGRALDFTRRRGSLSQY